MKQNKNDNRKNQKDKSKKENQQNNNKEGNLKANPQAVADNIAHMKSIYQQYNYTVHTDLHLKSYEPEFQLLTNFVVNQMFQDLAGIINNLGINKQLGIYNFLCDKANQVNDMYYEDFKISNVQAMKMVMVLACYAKMLKPIYHYKYIPQLCFDTIKNGFMNKKYLGIIQEPSEGYDLINLFTVFYHINLKQIQHDNKTIYKETKKLLRKVNQIFNNYLVSVKLIKLDKKHQYELSDNGYHKSFITTFSYDKDLNALTVFPTNSKHLIQHIRNILNKNNFAFNPKRSWFYIIQCLFIIINDVYTEDEENTIQMSKADRKYFKRGYGINIMFLLANVYFYHAVDKGRMYYEHKNQYMGTSPMIYIELVLSVFDYYVHDGEKTLSKPLLKLLTQLHSKKLNRDAHKVFSDMKQFYNIIED